LNGPCVDLNLMVAKSDGVAVRVERVVESLAVSASHRETLLVFAVDHAIALEITAGETATLEPWDLAVLSDCSARVGRHGLASSAALPSVFLATLRLADGD
jgi:hypothetical protein